MGSDEPSAGKLYRHFKGGMYRVMCIALDTETGDKLVIYFNEKDPNIIWSRPVEMFCEKLDGDGRVIKRFKEVNEDA